MSATLYPVTELDSNLVIRHVYDETTQTLRVNTEATIAAGQLEVAIDHTTDSIKIGDGVDLLAINADGSLNINIVSGALEVILDNADDDVLVYGNDGSTNRAIKTDSSGELQVDVLSSALPTGAATESTVSTINGKIPSGLTVSSTRLLVDGSGVTQPISGTVTANAGTDLNTSALALNTTVQALQVTQSSSTSGQSGTLVQGAVTTSSPSYTTAQTNPLSLDLFGNLRVLNTATFGILKTYSASSGSVLSAALATDIFTISGSSTKTIAISSLSISGTATAATVATIHFLKRSAVNTGGTPTTLTKVPNDSINAAATAIVTSYAGVPTTGTLVGNIRSFKLLTPPPTGGNANNPAAPIFISQNFTQPIILRGTGETLAINLGGVTIAGGNFAIIVEWTEI